ncbi:MAG: hypothetical protein IPJ79_08520 [Bacteroidetes bacterium]|nr:hypothetical protein [Bacteroidota bacterium]
MQKNKVDQKKDTLDSRFGALSLYDKDVNKEQKRIINFNIESGWLQEYIEYSNTFDENSM